MRTRLLAAITALGFLAAGCNAVWAQDAATFKVGLIDLDAVGEQFTQKQLEEEKLTLWYKTQQAQLQRLSTLLFLSAEGWQEAAEIIQTPQATPAQIEREQALNKQSTELEREYRDLEGKIDRTPEETERFNSLLDKVRARDADLKALAREVEASLQQQQHKLGVDLMKPVEDAIKAIAEEKGLDLVIDRKLVYLGGEDITELLVQRLNGTDAAATTAPPEEAPGETPAEGDGE